MADAKNVNQIADAKEIIQKRFIEPLKADSGHYVGIEIELPIVNLHRKAVDFDVVHAMTERFVKKAGFTETYRDDDGFIYLAEEPESGDTLSFDCSYNTLEFSFSREEDIHAVAERFFRYIELVQDELQQEHHIVTGMGINPGYRFNKYEPVANGRYRMLYHFLQSYKEHEGTIPFHPYPNYGMFSAASQIQLDVSADNVLEAMNAFNKLEPLKAILFANSVWEENPDILLNRDWLWVNSLHGLNPHNVGLLRDDLKNIDDLIDYIGSMSMYCTERDGHYLYFDPMTVNEYFRAGLLTGYYHDAEGKYAVGFYPVEDDIRYLRSFKYVDLTFRGTLELRSVCTQPLYESFTVAAFHAGLMEMLPELTVLLDQAKLYQEGLTPYVLRELLGRRSIPAFIDKRELSALLKDVLNLARKGLYRRGFHEEGFLDPLYQRASLLTNPAKEIDSSRMEDFILKYSRTENLIPDSIQKDFYHNSGVGLEEESLRVRPDGYIANTPHPFEGRDQIDRDFSEAQVEIVTPVYITPEGLYESIKRLRREVVETLWNREEGRELLWPFSNPPYLNNEEEIPIAQFYGDYRWKTRYRTYLAEKYGRQKMLLSGIHFNFSYPDYYLQTAFAIDAETDYRTFVNRRYLGLAEKAAAYSWLIVALTAASPVQDGSYWETGAAGEKGKDGYASLRCSEHGYWNDFIPTFDYRDIDRYIASVKRYVEDGRLKEERELYYPIRIKPSGRFRLDELAEKGINHIELRMIDLNPLYEAGIAPDDIRFMMLFLEWLEFKPLIYADDTIQEEFVRNMIRASHMPLEDQKIVGLDGQEVSLIEEGNWVLDDMERYLGKQRVIDFQREKLNHPQKRYAVNLQKGFADEFVEKGLRYATEQAANQMLLAELESMDGMYI